MGEKTKLEQALGRKEERDGVEDGVHAIRARCDPGPGGCHRRPSPWELRAQDRPLFETQPDFVLLALELGGAARGRNSATVDDRAGSNAA